MHAFMEHLKCGGCIYLRAGPEATEYTKPWIWGCHGEKDEKKSVTLVGYNRKQMPTPKLEPLKAMAEAAIAGGFDCLQFERLGGKNPRKVIFKHNKEGKLIMTTMPAASDAQSHTKSAHGSAIDLAKAEAGMHVAVSLFKDGTYALLDMKDVPLADGSELFIVHRKKVK